MELLTQLTGVASDINTITVFFFGLFMITMFLFLHRIEENIKLRKENEFLKGEDQDEFGYTDKERAEVEKAIEEEE